VAKGASSMQGRHEEKAVGPGQEGGFEDKRGGLVLFKLLQFV